MTGRLVVLDVGQGDALILHDPGSKSAVIVDCALPGVGKVRQYLKENDVDDVRGVIVTHLDADHYGGIPMLLEHVSPVVVACGIVKGFKQAHPRLQSFATDIFGAHERLGFDFVRAACDTSIGSPGEAMYLDFIGPTVTEEMAAQKGNSANNASAMIRAEVGGLVVLLAGDCAPSRWKRIIENDCEKLDADVLVLPHHGAKHDDLEVPIQSLLEAVSPGVIAVSVGSKNRYGHPDLGTLGLVGKWAVENRARLVCTQLNGGCANDDAKSGQLGKDVPCGGQITILRTDTALDVVTSVASHVEDVDRLAAPRCLAPLSSAA